ncbi:hypothetical protein [Fumia xinanensis]|uniref:Uncharacterized protein n=1 Tax=Fumia xinanensis TaxID=2763659 RepID=A0A926I741_9FIRM|nr:hypothetical protein [Fumia xinanensis]MBC8559619.1 hypothetical protein [Fumia xinanensis]
MFFKKAKKKQENSFKIWTEEDMIEEENKPDSPYGNINFSWYPNDLEDFQNCIKIAYRLVSPGCDISGNSVDYFRRFNRISTDIACTLCKDRMTATLIVYRRHWSEYTPEMQEYVDRLPQSGQDARYFLYPNMLLRIGRGVDRDLLTAYYKGREIDMCDSVSYNCFAMRDGFFESCPDSLFQIEIGSGAELVEKFLAQFSPIVRQRDMDVFHNEVEITVDRRVIPHEQVIEIVQKACDKQGGRLHISVE